MKILCLIMIIGILSLPIVLLFGNALEVSFDDSGMLSPYLRYGKGDISMFSEEEQEHLVEVKDFIGIIFIVFVIAMLVFILSLIYLREKIGLVLVVGGALTLIALFVIHLLTKNWDSAFTSFHKMFFKTQWQFAEGSLLIKMFPEHVFYNGFRKIVVNSLISSVGCIVLGVFLFFRKSKKT